MGLGLSFIGLAVVLVLVILGVIKAYEIMTKNNKNKED